MILYFTSTVIFLLLLGTSTAQVCNVNARCAQYADDIPDCQTDLTQIPHYKCVLESLKDCHNPVAEQIQRKENIKLTNDIFCKDKSLPSSFKQYPECWKQMKSCINSFGEFRLQIDQNPKEKNEICEKVKTTRDTCVEYSSEPCKAMVTKFIDIAHNQMICKPSSASVAIENFYFLILSILIVYLFK